jgi:hypothetical protein
MKKKFSVFYEEKKESRVFISDVENFLKVFAIHKM